MNAFLSPFWAVLLFAYTAYADGSEGGDSQAGSGGGGDAEKGYAPDSIVLAHGIMMAACFAILFPLGATILRAANFKGLVWFHGGWQVFTYIVALAAFGMGVWIADVQDKFTADNGHPIIGIIVISLLFLQSILGATHHLLFKRRERGTIWGPTHRWVGRLMLVLGVINGGLGLQLAHEDSPFLIAYSVVAGFFFFTWFLVVVITNSRNKRGSSAGKGSFSSTPRTTFESARPMTEA
jgi:hypothetical protein